jgi:transcriptional regulator of acetoin/glycerol metabolism
MVRRTRSETTISGIGRRLRLGLDVPAESEFLGGSVAKAITPLAQLEKAAIMSALQQCGGDKQLAARKLGIGKTTIYRKLEQYGKKKGR